MQQNSKFLYSKLDDVRDRYGPFSPEESSISYSSCNHNKQFTAEIELLINDDDDDDNDDKKTGTIRQSPLVRPHTKISRNKS
jgi:hypothetical protein